MPVDECSKGKGRKGKKKGRGKKAEDAGSSGEGGFERDTGTNTAGGNGCAGRGAGAARHAGAAASGSVPVLPAERAAPDADAAQPGHLHGDDGDMASVLARRLQAEWRVRVLPSRAQRLCCMAPSCVFCCVPW